MSNVVEFPKSRISVRKQIGQYIADHWRDLDAKELETILTPSEGHGGEMLAMQIIRIVRMIQYFVDISEYTRPLRPGEGWRLQFGEPKNNIWTFTIDFQREASETMCYKDIVFRFNLGVLHGTIDLPSEGAHIWPDITDIADGILTLETIQTVLKFYKDDHPKTEYLPIIRPSVAVSNELVPISRRAQIGPVYYGTSVCINNEAYPWIVVLE